MLVALPGEFWTLARKVEDLFKLQVKTRESLDNLSEKIEQLERRMTYLEASQAQVITEAKAAASAASTAVAGAILSDTVTRLTRLEIRMESLPAPPDRPALPSS
jgi:phage shock protein A